MMLEGFALLGFSIAVAFKGQREVAATREAYDGPYGERVVKQACRRASKRCLLVVYVYAALLILQLLIGMDHGMVGREASILFSVELSCALLAGVMAVMYEMDFI